MFDRRLFLILLVAFATGIALWATSRIAAPAHAAQPALKAAQLFPQPRVLPAFALQQSDGTQLTSGELKGHWTLVFLGYTHCPDVCPTTLAQLAQAQKRWEALPDATRPRLLFVSVDPDRDTPDAVGEYAHGFDRDTLAATADTPTLEAFANSLSLVFAKVAPPAGAPADAYSVDHSASMVLLDPQTRMAGVILPPLQPDAIAADMIALSRNAQ